MKGLKVFTLAGFALNLCVAMGLLFGSGNVAAIAYKVAIGLTGLVIFTVLLGAISLSFLSPQAKTKVDIPKWLGYVDKAGMAVLVAALFSSEHDSLAVANFIANFSLYFIHCKDEARGE